MAPEHGAAYPLSPPPPPVAMNPCNQFPDVGETGDGAAATGVGATFRDTAIPQGIYPLDSPPLGETEPMDSPQGTALLVRKASRHSNRHIEEESF